MRRSWACAAALGAALLAPAVASADILTDYQKLAARRLSPAPLVFTTAGPPLARIDRTLQGSSSLRRSGYGLRLVHYTPSGPDAVVALQGGSWRTVRAALRAVQDPGVKRSRTRIRGHAGHLLTGRGQRQLVWSEGGRVYWLATGTPRTVSLKELHAAATGLDPLGGAYAGSPSDPQSEAEAEAGGVAVTTAHTITVDASWSGNCTDPAGMPNNYYGGGAFAPLVRVKGNAFAFDVAGHATGSLPWSGTVSGTLAPGSVNLSVRATGTFDGNVCDSGPLSFTLVPVPIR
jgi:hypothetical protein